jgi:flagellar basal-body rod protein FlgG
MLPGLFTASSALDSFATSLNNTSNNLANLNTTAFKASTVSFEDLLYVGPSNSQVGSGVHVSSVAPLGFTQGTIINTGVNTNMAVNGTGFFSVQLPDGTMQYTRDGSFTLDSNGRLVNTNGYIVQPPITIPTGTQSITISPTGTVTIIPSGSAATPVVVGQVQLVSFPNQVGLNIEPGNLYSQSVASGPPTSGTPGSAGLGTVQQNSIEQSNVSVTNELTNLVTTQQAYAANSKVVTTANQMIGSTLQLVQ